MELQEALLALEEPANRISGGINALGIMATGLSSTGDPYTDGFNALWDYLGEADTDFREKVKDCLNLV